MASLLSTNTKPTDIIDNSSLNNNVDSPIVQYLVENYDKDNFLSQYFSLNEIISDIISSSYTIIGLQFAEELLFLSSKILLEIKSRLNNISENYKICIIGDTAYSECCIDDVSAQHYNVQYLIHFGRSCLSSYQGSLRISYSFGNFPSLIREHLSEVKSQLHAISLNHSNHPLLLLYDIYYHHEVSIFSSLIEDLPNAYLGTLDILEENDDCVSLYGRKIPANFMSPNKPTPIVIWIGDSQTKSATNFMLYFSSSTLYCWNKQEADFQLENLEVNKRLMRRYTMMEKTRDADIIGIVIGTMAVAKYFEVLQKVQRIIKNSGKQYYTYVVGKLNPHKLANFPEVDIFVLISCPESAAFDSRDFYKPLVTPLELEIALVGTDWRSNYRFDFAHILESEIENTVLEEVRYSLNTQSIHKNENNSAHFKENSSVLSTEVISAAIYYQNRSWRGLEQKIGETEVKIAEEGLSGLPMRYSVSDHLI